MPQPRTPRAAPEMVLAAGMLPVDWQRVRKRARRRAVAWSLRRIVTLPLLALAAIAGALKAWEGCSPVGLVFAPLFVVAALAIHLWDIVRTFGGDVEVLIGEVLGRLPDDYDERTYAFDSGRKREFLVDRCESFLLTRPGNRSDVCDSPEPRPLRATRRAMRDLRAGDDAVLVIVNDRIIDRLGRLVKAGGHPRAIAARD